jgi:peptidoglycan/xylan/chitin deacetylase (PgdA/CDA1 family)
MVNSRWRRNRLLILCYHGIAIEEEHRWRPSLFMDQDTFAQRLEALRRGRYNVLPLDEAVVRLYDGTLPERSVAITFDDGNHDFLARAFPLLQEHGFPSTVYLHSFYCVNPFPVFRLICSYLLWKARDAHLSVDPVTRRSVNIDLGSIPGRESVLRSMLEHAQDKGLSPAERDDLASRLADQVGIDYQELRAKRVLQVMTPEEVARVSDSGVDVQLHTHRHISPLDETLYREQIRENRAVIESIVRRPAIHFCYPSGNHHPDFLPWLRAERVVSATTCTPGIASRRDDPLLLPRLVDHGQISQLEFAGWLTGAASLIPRKNYVSKDAPAAG